MSAAVGCTICPICPPSSARPRRLPPRARMTPPKLPLSTSFTPFRISRLSDGSEALRIPSLRVRLEAESELRLRRTFLPARRCQKQLPDPRVGTNADEIL